MKHLASIERPATNRSHVRVPAETGSRGIAVLAPYRSLMHRRGVEAVKGGNRAQQISGTQKNNAR
jgi:hypothetical protein